MTKKIAKLYVDECGSLIFHIGRKRISGKFLGELRYDETKSKLSLTLPGQGGVVHFIMPVGVFSALLCLLEIAKYETSEQ